MTDILTDMAGSVAANTANYLALMKTLGSAWPALQVHDDPDMLWWFSGIPFPLFNGVAGARFEPDSADERIEAVIEIGRVHEVPLMWQLDPSSQPDDLGQRLEAHGFGQRTESPGMAVWLPDLKGAERLPEGVTLEPVRDARTLRDWARTLTTVFEMPDFVEHAFVEAYAALGLTVSQPVLHYLARLDGQSVATSSLFVEAGVAGIYNVAVLPAIRGRGIGGVITLAPLLDARAAGYRVGILQSSEMGYSIYERLGFEENCKLVRYFWQPEPESRD